MAEPGRKHHYTDTTYYLLGLIVERITGKPFHEVMHEFVFDPLGMGHAAMHGYSSQRESSERAPAELYLGDIDFSAIPGAPAIDYARGSVIAPLSDFLLFMQALTSCRIIRGETLQQMINDHVYTGFPTVGFDYGYSIWKPRTIPVILPAEMHCW